MIPATLTRRLGIWAACGLFSTCAPAFAQVPSLSLSSATGGPGTTISLALSLGGGGTAPAGLQWTLVYPLSQISAIGATAGPAATAAGKTLSCASAPGFFTCLLTGLNTNAISAGAVANIQVTLAAKATTTSISIMNAVGVAATGSGLPAFNTTGGTVAVPAALSSITCAPGSLNGGQISSCMAMLNIPAPSGGIAISLSSNNSLLTVPATITVPAGSSGANFNATAAATIPGNQSAVVTGTGNGGSSAATLGLLGPALSSIRLCTLASLTGGQISSCAAVLKAAAPIGGTAVSLSSNNPLLTVPATVTVPAGSWGVFFNATAAATIPSNQSAIITGTANGGSGSASFSLLGSVMVSGVACSPASLGQSAPSMCTVTLTQAAPAGGSSVTLASNNALLTVPATVTVAAGATTATFTTTAAASIASNQTATVTVSLGGSSQTATISLLAPVLVSGVTCSPISVGQSTTSICTLTLTQTAPSGGSSVTLASNNALLTVPATVTVAAGANTSSFSATAAASIASNQSATVTATLGGSLQTTTVSLVAPVLVSGLACSPATLDPGGSSNCGLSLSQAVPAISLVHVTSCGPQTFPASTCTIPATGSGNLIVVGWQAGGGVNTSITLSSVTDNAGNTYAEAGAALSVDTAAGSVADLWYAGNSVSGATTLTITPSSPVTNGGAVVWEFSGADLSAPLDQTAILNSQSANAAPIGAAVTTNAGADVVISLAAVAGNVTGISANTFVSDSALQGNGWAHFITSAAGTYAAQWNQSPAGTYASSTAAFKAAGNVMLTSNNPLLALPASVMVPVGASTATFSATAAAAIASNQTAAVTASLGGSSQTATVALLSNGAPALSSISLCTLGTLTSGQISMCSAILNMAAPAGGIAISLSSSNSLLTVPAIITVPAGSWGANFNATAAATIPSSQSVTITGTWDGVSRTTTISLVAPALSSLTCTLGILTGGQTSTCLALLNMPASAGGIAISLSSNNPLLTVPATIVVPAGLLGVSFNATAAATIPSNQSATIIGTRNGTSSAFTISLLVQLLQPDSRKTIEMQSISCESGRSHGICRIAIKNPSHAGTGHLTLASSNQAIKLPETVAIRPGQSSVSFRIDAISPLNDQAATITAQLDADIIQETVSLGTRPGPLNVPGYLYAKYGTQVRFRVSSSDPSAILAASGLPAGAFFDAASGVFQWVPDVASQGTHHVVFTQIGPAAGASATASSTIEVDSGTPVVIRVVNAASRSEAAACSPGAIASLEGKWLVDGPAASDRAGRLTELSGTVVRVNGIEAPILSVSISRADFLCPAAVPGSTLEIALQTSTGAAQPIQTISRESTPGIFSLDESGTGQGMIMHSGSATMVMTPNYQLLSRAALPDDPVTIYATGIAALRELSVVAGGTEVSPQSIIAIPNLAGMYQVSARLPAGPAEGDISISLKMRMPDGSVVTSNDVRVATETLQKQ